MAYMARLLLAFQVLLVSRGFQLAQNRGGKRVEPSSFILLTDPRSGSEWIMEVLDQHPEICASGEFHQPGYGFPREAFIPARYPNKDPEARANCWWRNMAPHLWRVASDESLCSGSREDWHARSNAKGFGDDLAVACKIRWRAAKRLAEEGTTEPEPARLVGEAWGVYFRLHMNESVVSGMEDRHLLACRCPAEKRVYGQKVMHEWIGDVSDAQILQEGWKDHPYMANYNQRKSHLLGLQFDTNNLFDFEAQALKLRPFAINYNSQRSELYGAPYYDLVGSLKELKSKVVLYTRNNMLARFVSLVAASQTGAFQCMDDDCAKKAAQQKVAVDVQKFRDFTRGYTELHNRTTTMLAEAGIETLELSYEACVPQPLTCLTKVANFLGVDKVPEDFELAAQHQKIMPELQESVVNVEEVRTALREDGHEDWLHESR